MSFTVQWETWNIASLSLQELKCTKSFLLRGTGECHTLQTDWLVFQSSGAQLPLFVSSLSLKYTLQNTLWNAPARPFLPEQDVCIWIVNQKHSLGALQPLPQSLFSSLGFRKREISNNSLINNLGFKYVRELVWHNTEQKLAFSTVWCWLHFRIRLVGLFFITAHLNLPVLFVTSWFELLYLKEQFTLTTEHNNSCSSNQCSLHYLHLDI